MREEIESWVVVATVNSLVRVKRVLSAVFTAVLAFYVAFYVRVVHSPLYSQAFPAVEL